MEIEPTLAFARRLATRRRPVWLRYVMVPGLTDDFDDIAKVAGFAAELGNVERVDVLPFHQMGKHKWAQLGLKYELADTQPLDIEPLGRAVEVFQSAGLKAF
jgi:pyruvate formate lyase activating enzyme